MRLIDADALYRSFGANGNCNTCALDAYRCQRYSEHTLMEFCGLIDDAPTIEAEPIRHGRWIEKTKVHPDLLNESTYNYECSNCGYWDTHGANVEVPYCWHCGAKMDEVKEDDSI